MNTTTYSIAEARNKFTALIRQAEEEQRPIRITRRGQDVAVISSASEYERLSAQQPQTDFWQAYLEWRAMWEVDDWDDTLDPFADVRDKSPGREINVWD